MPSVHCHAVQGGTVIGSTHDMDFTKACNFKKRTGWLKAAANLIKCQISNIICIGGDGSLTGASIFLQEWTKLKDMLVSSGTHRILWWFPVQKYKPEFAYLCFLSFVYAAAACKISTILVLLHSLQFGTFSTSCFVMLVVQ
jgi:6-phosphofructokinase